jgi:threonine dehydrogenase-like Zn-dependent dehydrogenase
MKAIVKHNFNPSQIRYSEIPEPIPKPGEALIEVKATGICGTDVSFYRCYGSIIKEYKPPIPIVMGHELCGRIADIKDANVSDKSLNIGDRVIANPLIECGNCSYCRAGRTNICDHRIAIGLQRNGSFAQYVTLPIRNLYRIPGEIPYDIGALGEPLSIALHATESVKPSLEDIVLVFGPGPIGLLIVLLSKSAGAKDVILVGVREDKGRLEIGESLGANIYYESDNLERLLRRVTDGRGADIVFDASGNSRAIARSLSLARKRGTIGLVGIPHDAALLQTSEITFGEKRVMGVRGYVHSDWVSCQDLLMRFKTKLKPLITHRLSLDEAKAGMTIVEKRKGEKVVLLV